MTLVHRVSGDPICNDTQLADHVWQRFHIPLFDDEDLAESPQQELLIASLRVQAESLMRYDPPQEHWTSGVMPHRYRNAAQRQGLEWDYEKEWRLYSYLLDYHRGIDFTKNEETTQRLGREDECGNYLSSTLLRIGYGSRLDWRSCLSHIYMRPDGDSFEESEARFWSQFRQAADPAKQQMLLTLGVPQESIEREVRVTG